MVIYQYKVQSYNFNPKAPPTTDITWIFLTAKPRFDNQGSSCWNCDRQCDILADSSPSTSIYKDYYRL
jgi:hypothetical protein